MRGVAINVVMRSQTEVHPLLALLAIVAGGSVGGLLGMLVAVPVVAALRVLVARVLAPAIRERTGAGTPEVEA